MKFRYHTHTYTHTHTHSHGIWGLRNIKPFLSNTLSPQTASIFADLILCAQHPPTHSPNFLVVGIIYLHEHTTRCSVLASFSVDALYTVGKCSLLTVTHRCPFIEAMFTSLVVNVISATVSVVHVDWPQPSNIPAVQTLAVGRCAGFVYGNVLVCVCVQLLL